MAFRFPLQALLRVRQSVERQQELRLQEAKQRVAAVERKVDEVERSRAALGQFEREELQIGVSAAQLQFDVLLRSVLMRQRKELETERARREELRDQRRRELQFARQQREAVESLRTQGLRAYREEQNRREQRRLDDLFLLRREFLLR